ncbi:MAG: hypothetical protein JWO44_1135 [Bacteroidetes bacterium]|nr:hypothetical protein [Bacteroidota bacterium]
MKNIIALFLLFSVSLSCFSNKEAWDDNKDDWSELMLAIYKGQTAEYKKLISEGSDVNFITPGTHSNWSLAAMDVAIRKSNAEAVRILLATHKIKEPGSYMMTACGESSAEIIELLISNGGNPNETLDNGYSVLMMAASFGSAEVLECLLKHKANVNQVRYVDGITPLMLAAFNGEPEKVKLLLAHGADKSRMDKNGKTALGYVDGIYEYLKISGSTKAKLRELLK